MTNLLLVSDSVSASSGLARITRDLALRVSAHFKDTYRIATAGYGGHGSSKLPWTQYQFSSVENWHLPELPSVVEDFAGEEECVVMFLWDASRVDWVARPEKYPHLSTSPWLLSGAKVRKWLYHPIDASGPNGKVSHKIMDTIAGFERVLNYSKFSSNVTDGGPFIPHGIDASVFKKQDRGEMKRRFRDAGFQGLEESSFLVGIVATNQPRKDWALGFQTCKELLDRGLDVRLWCHTDVIARHWDLGELVRDYGLSGRVIITNANFPDEQMAKFYSACDVTLGTGSGEGFGYPIFESIYCGTPCIHGNYGGAAELLPANMKVEPIAFRYEGPYCCERPVFRPEDWAAKAHAVTMEDWRAPAYLDWELLWLLWQDWFIQGVKI